MASIGGTEADEERLITVPNLLTLARVPLAGAVWIDPDRPVVLLPIVAVAAVTDLLDGRVARALRGGRPSVRGAWLDPLCDKIFVLSVLAAIAVAVRPPLALVGLIALRELLLAPLLAIYRLVPGLRQRRHVVFQAGKFGKAATAAQFAAVAALVMAPAAAWPLAALAAAAGLVAVVVYVKDSLR